MSKLKAGEIAVWVTERAIQILGGNGYPREFPVERMAPRREDHDIFEGTSEIQRLVISRAISGLKIQQRGNSRANSKAAMRRRATGGGRGAGGAADRRASASALETVSIKGADVGAETAGDRAKCDLW